MRKPSWKNDRVPIIGSLLFLVVVVALFMPGDWWPRPKPMAVQPAAQPVAAQVPAKKMIKWDYPFWGDRKQTLEMTPEGSDTIPVYRGLDIVFMPRDTTAAYRAYTSMATAGTECRGYDCKLAPGFDWITFRGAGTISFWFEPHR